MFRIVSMLLLAIGLVCSSVASVTAQDGVATPPGAETDIASIAAVVLGADPTMLLAGLDTPPANESLPPGFLNPPSGEPANADVVEAFALPTVGLEGTVGAVTHFLDTDANVINGLVSAGIVNYVVADSEITDEDFGDFELRVAQGIRDNLQPGLAGDVKRIPLADREALLISVLLQGSGTIGLIFMVAIPVGNVLVIGSVIVIDSAGMDSVAVLEHAVVLSLTGIAHLSDVAETTG